MSAHKDALVPDHQIKFPQNDPIDLNLYGQATRSNGDMITKTD